MYVLFLLHSILPNLSRSRRALAALTRPVLFSSLILVDPVIAPPYVDRSANVFALALGAVQRRHTWKNREEAKRLLAANPFFAAWDPEVLDNYVQFALTQVNDGGEGAGVKLKMPGVQVCPRLPGVQICVHSFHR